MVTGSKMPSRSIDRLGTDNPEGSGFVPYLG